MRWIRWTALLAGIAIFAVSFMLTAVKEASASPGSPGVRGFTCAVLTLQMPWSKDGRDLLKQAPVQYFSILLSGWINPAYIVALLLVITRPRWRVSRILTYAVTFMFIFCWIVFFQLHLYPRQGYFLWMFGILLALYSSRILRTQLTPEKQQTEVVQRFK